MSASQEGVRNRHPRPLSIGGRWVCIDCRADVEQKSVNGQKCKPPSRCESCTLKYQRPRYRIQKSAAAAVSRAIKAGVLAPVDACLCADCGSPAKAYDHRDYTKPLQVEPVCDSCNLLRGSADVWPDVQAYATDGSPARRRDSSELTDAQASVLAFINEYRREHQMPPTRVDIAKHFGWRSANAAEDHLRALQRKGAIWLKPGRARGIHVNEAHQSKVAA